MSENSVVMTTLGSVLRGRAAAFDKAAALLVSFSAPESAPRRYKTTLRIPRGLRFRGLGHI